MLSNTKKARSTTGPSVEVGGIEPSQLAEDPPGPHQPSQRKRAARQKRTKHHNTRSSPGRARPTSRSRRWRWGESNPRPTRFQRRHLRAQPTASFRNLRDAVGSFSWVLVGIVLPRRSRHPGGGILHCYARIRRDRHPPVGHAALIMQRMRNFRYWHLCLFPAL